MKPASSSTGFVIVERLLQERKQKGRCQTAERWVGEAKAKLAQYRSANTSAKAHQDAGTVERAYVLAGGLVEVLATEKK